MIVDVHVAGISRSLENRKLTELVQKDKAMQFIQKLYGQKRATPPTIEDYVRAMKNLGVDKLIVHSVGYYPATCQALNNATKVLCEKFPEQLVGFATAPLAYPKQSVHELNRAVKDLELRGLKIYPKFQGVALDSEKMQPLYKEAERLGIPVLTHSDRYTGSYTGSSHMREIDNTACNTARLFRSSILESTPRLTMILAHLGGGIMFYKDDLYAMSRTFGESDETQYFDRLFDQFYYDLAPANWWSERIVQMAIDIVGEDRLLFGTDFPLPDAMREVEKCIKHVAAFNLPESTKRKILGENAKRLLNLK